MLTKEYLVERLKEFEIESDSILMVHSSLKALGTIDGGAETVIASVEETVKDGTLVFPALLTTDWEPVIKAGWHLDRPSEVGYISELFRTQEGSIRSMNPTHSVSARGRNALDIISGDEKAKPRFSWFDNYGFSWESAWQRMYESRERYGVKCYVMFWGVNMKCMTFKHLVEAWTAEYLFDRIKDEEKRAEWKKKVTQAYYKAPDEPILFPFYKPSIEFTEVLCEIGAAKRITVGEGEIICADVFETLNAMMDSIKKDPYWNLSPNFMKLWYADAVQYME